MNIETENWNLIARYLKGDLSDQERHELSEWINANPANKLLFEQVKNLWIASENEQDLEVDVESNWNRFKKTVSEEKQPQEIQSSEKQENQTFWPMLFRVAAVLVVGFAGAYFLRESLVKNDLIVLQTMGEKKEFMLPDSSFVFLNNNSKLSYAKDFNIRSRIVNLEGEAFFEVKKAEGQRFIVYAKNAKTEVIGTSFTVTAYENEPNVEVKVLTGKVAFSLQDETNTVFLEPGRKGLISGNEQIVEEKAIEDPNFLSWKTQKLYFDNTKFDKVIKSLESYFGEKVAVNSPEIYDCRYSGTFENPDIESTLEVISATMNLTYKKEKNTWIIDGPGCK